MVLYDDGRGVSAFKGSRMKDDCKWLNDVECPYATGYQECDDCDKYEKDDRSYPLDDSGQADYLRDMAKDMGNST